MLVFSRREGEETFIDIPPTNRPMRIVHTTSTIHGDKVRQGYTAYYVNPDGSLGEPVPEEKAAINRKEVFIAKATHRRAPRR